MTADPEKPSAMALVRPASVTLSRHSVALSGDAAARAFSLLDSGASPAVVVVQLKLSPSAVDSLWRSWARMRGHVLLGEDGIRAISSACLAEENATDDIVSMVRRALDEGERICPSCGAGVARYCVRCPSELARVRGRQPASLRRDGRQKVASPH